MTMTDFSPAAIEARIHAAIMPTLLKADALYDHYRPLHKQVVGKHHPMYDTLGGRLSHMRHKMRKFQARLCTIPAEELAQCPR